MIKLNFKMNKNSKIFSFARVVEKRSSKSFDDISEMEELFQPRKKKKSFLSNLKKQIDNSKIGGLIYIAVFVLVLFVGYATVRRIYYSESVTPEEYEVVELHQKRAQSRRGEIGRDYLKVIVEFEAEGDLVSTTLYYDGACCDAIYKDWCAYYAFYDSDKEDTYSYLEQYEKVKKAIGVLHYNKKHPEKVVDSILGY